MRAELFSPANLSLLCVLSYVFPSALRFPFRTPQKGRSERRRRRGNRRWMRWRSSVVDEAAGGRPTLLLLLIPLCSLSLFRFQSWDFVIDLSPRELRSESKAMPHTLLETESPWSLFFCLLEKRGNRNSLRRRRRGTCNLCGHPTNVPYFSPSPRSHTERRGGGEKRG